MSISKKPYKGCRDLFPEQKRSQDYLFEIMKKTAHSFGYEPYDGHYARRGRPIQGKVWARINK